MNARIDTPTKTIKFYDHEGNKVILNADDIAEIKYIVDQIQFETDGCDYYHYTCAKTKYNELIKMLIDGHKEIEL